MRRLGAFLRRYFIPHEENDYRPHILQKTAALGILLLIMTTFTVVNIQSLVLVSSDWYASSVLPAVLVDLTNSNRSRESLGALTRNSTLDEAARLKAEDMAAKEYFAHDSPEGLTPWYWFGKVGYEYAFAGENLAVHFSDSDEVVKAWMNSPGHRANIMDEKYTEIGIGTARGSYKGSPTIFVVQLFGKPLSVAARAKVVAAIAREDTSFEEQLDSFVAGASAETENLKEEPTSLPVPSSTPEHIPSAAGEPSLTETEPSVLVTEEVVVPTTHESAVATPDAPSAISLSLFDVATASPYVTNGVIPPDLLEGGSSGEGHVPRLSTPIDQLASRPNLVISIVYSILASLVFLALVISIAIEWRRHHPVQMLYGAGLLAAMWVALYVHTTLFVGALIV